VNIAACNAAAASSSVASFVPVAIAAKTLASDLLGQHGPRIVLVDEVEDDDAEDGIIADRVAFKFAALRVRPPRPMPSKKLKQRR
jgi:hypothetical protein